MGGGGRGEIGETKLQPADHCCSCDGVTHSYSLLYFCVGLKKGREIALMGRIAVLVG